MKNYYEILEVSKKASTEVIEKAYRVLVKKYHPDSGVENQEKIKEINEAYKVLSDDFLRNQYDNELEKDNNINKAYNDNVKANNTISNQKKSIFNKNKEKNDPKIGSLRSLIDLTKTLIEDRPNIDKKQKFDEKTIKAMGLTAVVVIIIGIILWFIPFTNGWMRQFLFETPIWSWIWKK